MKKVLISGGSGTIGRRLSDVLLENNIEVRWLSTSGASKQGVQVFDWEPDKLEMDPSALEDVDTVFNLAGKNIAVRWTPRNRKEIIDSRVNSAKTFIRAWEEGAHRPSSFISSSAVGYYPSDEKEVMTELHVPGSTFISDVVVQWEKAVNLIAEYNIRVVKLRTGVVLDVSSGALAKMLPVFKWGFGSPLGTGRQGMPWIHIDDMASAFIHAAEQPKMSGSYNVASPNQVTNAEFSKVLASTLNKPYFFPAVPQFALNALMGEMASIATNSNWVSVEKLAKTGFEWEYPELETALEATL